MQFTDRPNLSDEVADRLRDMIFDGDLGGDERINEVHVARTLGASRTCVREALSALLAEEAVYAVPRRGCFVRPLTRNEFEDLYPIRAILDPEALRLAGVPEAERLGRLRRMDESMQTASSFPARLRLDEAWHRELIGHCPNEILTSLSARFTRRFHRYALAFGRDASIAATSASEHAKILDSLEDGNVPVACDWLRRNLSSDKEPIVRWLAERDACEAAA
jgi:DNA-binding GntR family transcriptional regulator